MQTPAQIKQAIFFCAGQLSLKLWVMRVRPDRIIRRLLAMGGAN